MLASSSARHLELLRFCCGLLIFLYLRIVQGNHTLFWKKRQFESFKHIPHLLQLVCLQLLSTDLKSESLTFAQYGIMPKGSILLLCFVFFPKQYTIIIY